MYNITIREFGNLMSEWNEIQKLKAEALRLKRSNGECLTKSKEYTPALESFNKNLKPMSRI